MSNTLLKTIYVSVADGLFKKLAMLYFLKLGLEKSYLLVRKLSSLPKCCLRLGSEVIIIPGQLELPRSIRM